MRAIMLAIALLACTTGARATAPDLSSPVAILKWIDGYRETRDAETLPDAVHAMADAGLFTGQDKAAFYIGFIAGVLGDNQVTADKLIDKVFPIRPEHQAVIIKAIAFSGLPDWKLRLEKFAERMPARQMLIANYLKGDGKTLMALPLNAEPNVLDTLWGYYFATGYHEPILRVISGLAWSTEDEDVEKLTIGSMAAWTLASNAARNQDLLSLYHIQHPHQPKSVAKPLWEVIEAVEYFDAERVRRQAQKAIEDLKRKSLAPKSTWEQWRTQAGSTVLALGCVVATATGHPEIGAPCVIAGALYSGATKLIQSYPK